MVNNKHCKQLTLSCMMMMIYFDDISSYSATLLLNLYNQVKISTPWLREFMAELLGKKTKQKLYAQKGKNKRKG